MNGRECQGYLDKHIHILKEELAMENKQEKLLFLFTRLVPLAEEHGHWLNDDRIQELIRIVEGEDDDVRHTPEWTIYGPGLKSGAVKQFADLLEQLGVLHRTPVEISAITGWRTSQHNREYATLSQMIQVIGEKRWLYSNGDPPGDGWRLVRDVPYELDQPCSPTARLWSPLKEGDGGSIPLELCYDRLETEGITALGARHACAMLLEDRLISCRGGVPIPDSWRNYYLAFVGTAWTTGGTPRVYGLKYLGNGRWHLRPVWMDRLGSRTRVVVANI